MAKMEKLVLGSKLEEEFSSCCGEEGEEEWQETGESFVELAKDALDEVSVRMFFKGVSSGGKAASGIGVVMERSPELPVIKVQKKMEFFVDELVADHLALMDGILVALENGIRKVFAFTNSEKLYFQIAETEILEDKLLVALGHRILELVDKLEDFDLTLVPSFELERSLRLASEAIGIMYVSPDEVGTCPICYEERRGSQMTKICCSHKFCSSCLVSYVEDKLQASKVPIRCPHIRCKYIISAGECKAFLPVGSHESLERAFAEAGDLDVENFYCPFSNCSAPLDLSQHFSSRANSSSQSDFNCLECPECHQNICISCSVPWHTMMSCEDYQNLPIEERDAGDLSLHRLAQNNRWRRCQRCRRMIELTQGCYHMICWCRHEFCYSCGAEYTNGIQTCQCVFWDEDIVEAPVAHVNQQSEIWAWDTFDFMPNVIDSYSEQERAQLALFQRFLAGGFSLGDHPCQSPPRCSDAYMDTMKDLHQLPWLERFVSVISDSYNEDYIQ